MMMDLFLKSTKLPKKRVHFHKFMLNVHQIIHQYKQGLLQQYGREKNLNMDPSRDPILHCARVIRESAQLLCFDEFQVTDIADAIIMTKVSECSAVQCSAVQ
jgi:predicted ATPase